MTTVVDILSKKELLDKFHEFSGEGRKLKAKREALLAEFREREKPLIMEQGDLDKRFSQFLQTHFGIAEKDEYLMSEVMAKIASFS